VNLRQRAAELERLYNSYDPKTQAAVIETAAVLLNAINPKEGGCPMDMLLGIFDLVQNVGGKLGRGLITQATALADVKAGAPTLASKFLAKVTAG
jgi:hypothetical protein